MKKASKNFFTTLEDDDNLAHNVDVIWAAKKKEGVALTSIDVGLQLASAGYYTCLGCGADDDLLKNGEMDALLNNAPASYEGMVVKFKNPKKHIYGCTRNNNFSNRSQKATITVVESKKK